MKILPPLLQRVYSVSLMRTDPGFAFFLLSEAYAIAESHSLKCFVGEFCFSSGDPRRCALCHKIAVSLWLMCAATEGLKLIGFIFWSVTEPIN